MPPDSESPFQVRLGTDGKGDPLTLRNPVIAAAGCFPLLTRRWTLAEVAPLGAACTPSIATRAYRGGAGFAIEEAPAGLVLRGGYPTINLRLLREEIAGRWQLSATPLIATVRATDPDECAAVVAALADAETIAGIELSLIDPGYVASAASDASSLPKLVERVRRLWSGALIVKLLPAAAATAAPSEQLESAGASAISVGGGFGALSRAAGEAGAMPRPCRLVGPATRPLALRQVAALCRTSRLPVIAAGGVATIEDVLAFLAVGAAAVQVGSVALRSPLAAVEIARAVDARLAGGDRDMKPGPGAATMIG